jgi:hypothetical protein
MLPQVVPKGTGVRYLTVTYYWQNSDIKTRKVRFSLLSNWEQIPWPSGDMFVDVYVEPGNIYYNELLLSDLSLTKYMNNLSVVAFVDPDISFWYYDDDGDLKANHYASQAFSTLRSIIYNN